MNTTSTPTLLPLFLLIFWLGQLTNSQAAFAQANTSPIYQVNLTGQPNGIWTSGELDRSGKACGATGNVNCIQFSITLDKNSAGLEFSIVGGPVPSGSMTYQVNCGTPVPVGQPICVTGTGPHVLTICMPGGAKNKFQVKSIAAFTPVADKPVSGGCTTTLQAPLAFETPSISWTDITGGGAYNKYLSCISGCATPTVTPDANAPAFVDYVVCGTSVQSPCSDLPFCDTVRVYFYKPPVIAINPTPAIICPGSSGVDLTGIVTGGSGTFTYLWTNSSGTLVGSNKTFTATTPGLYTLEVRTENYPSCQKFSATVNVVTDLSVNAGPDQLVCSLNPVRLAGSVSAATGGVWSGGSGTFSPSNTALNAVYTPTANELKAGSVKLTLTSTGNGSCSAVSDDVLISFYNMAVTLAGPSVICTGATASLTATVTGAEGAVTYKWNTGETTASIANKPAGTYTVTVTDGKACAVQKSFTVTQVVSPSDLAFTLTSTTCGASNGIIKASGVTNGTAPFTYSLNGGAFQTTNTFSGLIKGTYSVQVKDANGCVYTESVTLQDIPGPTGITFTSQPTTCGNSNGTITVTGVTGGTSPYTYSLNQGIYQTSGTFSALSAGTHTVMVKDANGCTFSKTVTVTNVAGPASFAITTGKTTCGNSNGSITVTGVTGGTSPYAYSLNGTTFQSASSFTNVAAGTYSITVKDANGCTVAQSVSVDNIAGPTALAASTVSSTCGNNNGQLTLIGVTGGTAPYTYSLNNGTFQSAGTFSSLLAGSYTASVKDANGCTFTKTFVVSNIAGPSNVTASTQATTCGGTNGTITLTGVTGGTSPYTYSLDGTTFQTSASFSDLKAATYTITVKDANGCVFTKAVVLQNISGPTDYTLTATATTCGNPNGSVVASNVVGGTAPYTYSKDGTTFQTSASFSGLTAGSYSITVKDANGCILSKSISLSNIAGPSAVAASTRSTTCGASNGELLVTSVTGGTAPYTYSKDGTTFQNSASFLNLVAGTYTITVKDANGCTVAKTFTVSNITGPTAVTAKGIAASCLNNDGSLSITGVTGGTAPYSYSINGSIFQNGTSFTGLATGNYTVTVKDANGCLVTALVTVGKNVPTAFAATVASTTCGNSNGSITLGTVTGGTAPYTYSKDGTTFQTATTFTNLAAGTHTITVKDVNGCTFSRQITITNIAGPSGFVATAKSTTCGNANGELSIGSIASGTAPFTYSLDGISFQASATFTDLEEGQYNLTVKDANGCTITKSATIANIPGPTAFSASTQTTSCGRANGGFTITAVTGGTAPYTYSTNGTTFQTSATFSSLLAGTYTVAVKDANGCVVSQPVTIQDVAGPSVLRLTSTSSTCGRNNGTIEVEATTGGSAPYTYALNGGAFQTDLTFTGILAGTHTILVKDANGCTFSQTISVTDVAGPSNLLATTKASTCGSSNGEVTLTGVTGGTAPYTYSKDGSSFQASATFVNLMAGTYTITVKDANGCSFAKSVTVTNITGPTKVTATVQPASCQNNDGSLTITGVIGGTAPYLYSINGSSYQSEALFAGLATGTYTVYAKDANGCLTTTSVLIKENAPVNFVASAAPSTCGNANGSISIGTITGGTAPYLYSADGGTFQTSATLSDLLTGSHSITIKDSKGCTITKQVTVSNITGPTNATFTNKASTCGNANAELTVASVSGGTAPYTYSVDGGTFQASNTFTGLAAGSHILTIKDANGCTFSKPATLTNIAGPSDFTASPQATSCGRNNGSISIAGVVNGTAPYTYSINGAAYQSETTFSSLTAGVYTLSLKDANGCVVSKDITVRDIAGPAGLTLTSIASTCGASNGSILIKGVTGGTAPYSYALSSDNFQNNTSYAGLATGDYTITVKDANGCTFSEKIRVENEAGPTAISATLKSSTCGASNGELVVSGITGGAAPYTYAVNGSTYQNSPTFTALAAGIYTLTVTDANGCTFQKSFTLTNIVGPTAITASSLAASCQDNDGSIKVAGVDGGTAPYQYAINGGVFQASVDFSSLAAGTYSLIAKDANGCEVSTTVLVKTNLLASFTKTTVSSTCGSSNGSITITGVSGGTAPYMYSVDGINFQTSTTLSGLLAGTYNVTIKDAKGCTVTNSVMVNNIAGSSSLASVLTATTCGNSNGKITISGVTGGTNPYTYSLDGITYQTSTSFTGLTAGTYTLWVKDAKGCTYSKAVTLSDVAGPSGVMASTQPASCLNNDGSVTVGSVTGGTAPYNYSINGSTFQASATFTGVASGTYTLTVKDAYGCTTSTQVQVDKNIPTAFNSTTVSSTCGSNNGSLTVTGITGGFAPYTYSKNGTTFQTSATFTELAAGAWTITVKDAKGCTFTDQVTIVNIPGPTDFTTNATASTCGNRNGELTIGDITGGTAPYTYALNGGAYQASATFSGLVAGTYQIAVKDANGCLLNKTVQVTNIAGPALSATTKASTCGTSNGQITATATSGTAPYQYSLDGVSFQSENSFLNLMAGAYTVTVKDANGCITTTSVSVTNINGPTALSLASTASTCGNKNGMLAISGVTGGTAPYHYSLDGTTFQASTNFGQLLAGTYTITVKDVNGCTFTQEAKVTNIPGPSDFTLSSKASTCGGSNGTLTISAVEGGTAPYMYSLEGGVFQTSATFSNLTAGTYSFTVKDANGCTLAKEATITDVAGPSQITAAVTSTTCSSSNGTISISGVTGGTGPYTYSRDGVTFQTGSNFSGLAAGTYTLLVKDANGCTLSKIVTLENITGPSAIQLAGISSTCGNANGEVVINGVTGGTAPYLYSLDGGAYQATPSFQDLLAGTHTVMVKDANGCTTSKSIVLENISGPSNLVFSTVSSTCGNSNGSLTVTSTVGGTVPYQYSVDGINFQASTTFTGLAAGTHTVTVKDTNGCSFKKAVTVTNIAGPTALTASSTSASCQNNDGSVTVGTITGGTAPFTYSINGTTFQTEKGFTGLAAGTYTVYAKDANGCLVTKTVVVEENVPTRFTWTAKASTCGRSDGELTIGQVTGGTGPYLYSQNGTTFQASATFNNLAAGTYTITVKDSKGCLYRQTVSISNISGPVFTVASSNSTCGSTNGAITITGTSGGMAPYTYSKDGTTFQTGATFSNLKAGTYAITAKDVNGCVSTETVTVKDTSGPTDVLLTAASSTCGNSNGTIIVGTVTAGTAPFSYSINGTTFQASATFANLKADSYTIIVKDANGCRFSKSIQVENIAGPTQVLLVTTASTCGNSNGTVSINGVQGGTAPYQFSLNGSTFQASAAFANVLAGEHTVVVKDVNGCTFTQKVTLTNIAGPSTFAFATQSSICGSNNGAITITGVTGGTAPYTYSKDGVNFQADASFTGVLAGAHIVTVKDANGCTVSKSVSVSDVKGPTAIATSIIPSSCADNDGSIKVSGVTGGTAPFQYSLNGAALTSELSFTGLGVGTYTLKVRDANGCEVSTSVKVEQNLPTTFAFTTVASTCGNSNGSITIGSIAGGFGPYQYSKDGTTFQTGATFSGLMAGNHTLTVKDARGCVVSKSVTLNNLAGPSDLFTSIKASTCADSNGEITISTVTGGTAPYTYSKDGGTFQTSANFTNLSASAYLFTVKDANGCIYKEEVTLQDISGPSFTAVAQASTCSASNGTVTVRDLIGGTAPFTYSKDGKTFQTSATFTGLMAGTYTILVKDANGCSFSRTVKVENVAGPSDLQLTATASTCGSSNGAIEVREATGGTAPFTYALDGGAFQTSTYFDAILNGEHTIHVKDANGCTYSEKITVTDVAGPSAIVATAKASTCGNANGELVITEVVDGTAPFTYSKDGATFQATSTFTGLAAGSYTITVKDANGCTTSKVFTVNNTAGPTLVATTTNPASCSNQDGRLTIASVTGGKAPYSYSINGTTFQPQTTFEAIAAGTYTITVKDANGCLVTATAQVGQNVPTAFASTTVASTCGQSNGKIQVTGITGGTAPYSYSLDGTTFQSASSFSGVGAGTHTVFVKDAKGCTYSGQVQVTNVAGPTAFILNPKASTCGNANGQATVGTVTGGTAPFTYSLDGATFQTGSTFSGLMANEYTITVKDANGCTFSQQVIIQNVAGPSDLIAETKASSCGRSNGQVSVAQVTGGTGPYTYSLNGGNFQTSNIFTGLPAGSFLLMAKDANGCISSNTITITNVAGPTEITTTLAASTCGAQNGSIHVTATTGGTAPYTYALGNGNFQVGTTFASLAAGDYTLTVKDANGCTHSTQVTVENIAGPSDLVATVTSSTCGEANGQVAFTKVLGGTEPYVYSIDGTSFQSSVTFADLLAGTHTFTVKDANGCTLTKAFTVTNLAGPTKVVAASTLASCQGADGSITVGTVTGGMAPYRYSVDGTLYQSGPTFASLTAGRYTVTVKDANGCLVSTSITVDTNTPKAVTSTTKASTCGNSNGEITITSVTGGTAPYQYSVNGLDFQASASFTGLEAGTHTITVKDAKGCTVSHEVAITNIAGPSGFASTVQASTCGLANGEVTLGNITGGTEPFKYSLDGQVYQASATFKALAAGTYTITVKDANGCIVAQQVEITNVSGPSAFALETKASTCGHNNGSITITEVTAGTAPYSYSKDGSTFQASSVFSNLPAGEYTFWVKDANGCTISKAVRLDNVPGPSDLLLTNTASTCGAQNGTITLSEVTGGTAPFSYALNNGAFQAEADFANVKAGTYTITVKDANGCTFSQTITVRDIAGPSGVLAQTTATTCGASNGAVTITSVSGGTAPYSYSLNGNTYQAAATFQKVAAGTYTIHVKDANSCTFTTTVTVASVAGPSALASTTTSASCTDQDGSLTVTGVTGGTAPYSYSINGGNFQNSATFTALASGRHVVTAKDANGCETSATVQIGQQAPVQFAASASASTCAGTNGKITVDNVTGGSAPYSYSLNGGSFQSGSSFTGLTAGTYTITVKDAKGCTHTEQVEVRDVAGFAGMTASVQAATCNASNGKLTVSTLAGGTAPFQYSLDGNTFQSAATFIKLEAGKYTVWVKDANGCTFSQEAEIPAIEGPSDFKIGVQASACGNANGTISVADITGGVAPFTYSKDGSTFQASAVFENLPAGTYAITVKDANGCTHVREVEVEKADGPKDFMMTSLAPACGKSTGSVTVSEFTGGTAPFTIALEGGNLRKSAKNVTSFTFDQLPAGSYTVSVIDVNGCSLTRQITLTDQKGITAFITSTKPVTCSEKGTLTVTATTGGTAPFQYSLDGTTFQVSNTFTQLAAATYTVHVKDTNGCSAVATVKVIENKLQEATLTATPEDCGLKNGSITATNITGGTEPYSYSLNGGTFQATASFKSLTAGSYTFAVKDATGCVITQSITVGSTGGVQSFILAKTDATCGSNSGTVTVGQVTGGQSPYTYSINGTYFQTSPAFTGLAEGTYQMTVKDAKGCQTVQPITVASSQTITKVSFTAEPAGCGQATGRVTVTEVTGGVAPYTYSLNGTTFTSNTLLIGIAPGTYQLTVKDAKGCTYSTPVAVTQVGAQIALVKDVLCQGDANGSILLSTQGAKGQAEFSINNGQSFQKDSVFSNLAAGTYEVVARFNGSCTMSLGKITVKAPAVLKVAVKPLTASTASVTSISGGTAPYTYQVDQGAFITESEFQNLTAGNHTLVVKDKNGCTLKVTFTMPTIEDGKGIEIPTGFTPNGDGINDVWVLKNVSTYFPGCSVTVYNRWGSPVFESRGYAKPWDGTHMGKPVPAGTYYTVVELGNGQPAIRKSLTIIR
ncbi:T9SS type B sorting domain-containing protein [Nibribacter ruber]|uniref:T9SS type B sorting domain-containing protein n=1 Tax=Nibribacter ruber TaxID=2698458 RepID=A0A6P1P1E3_9BACT|nr:gliding motility-associated C-terminal domain-containing protein [Nibribacter ruber]QHL87503.1 T9SS type B sorting domain-containing protein [Nibribacter ruber]